jgi:alpha-mannosidase
VPSHQWFDLTDTSGTFGVTVLSDCKNASDKPDDSTLRLTLLRTPGIGTRAGYADQSTQEGRHEFVYGLAGHAGDWRAEQTDWQAQRLDQPLIAFEARTLRRAATFSLASSVPAACVLALKRGQNKIVVARRLAKPPRRAVQFTRAGRRRARINGAEEPVGGATVATSALVCFAYSFDRGEAGPIGEAAI